MSIQYVRPSLYEKQSSAFFNDARIATIEASTKSGKTHGGMAWLFEQAALKGKPGKNYWWTAPVYPQTKIAYRRLKRAIPQGLRKPNETELTLTLANQAVLWFKSGDRPDNLFGEDVEACVIDEASRLREEAWHAVRSTLTKTRGPVRIIGNVKGRKNWFYRLCRRAEAGEPSLAYSKIIAADAVAAGILSADEVEAARRDLPESVFRELYLAEPSEDGSNPFGLSHIAACCTTGMPSAQLPAGFGVDLAKSVDWTVAIGLDRAGDVCAFDRFRLPWQETEVRLHDIIKRTRAVIDSTGVGDPVVESLQRGGRSATIEGFKFTSTSKQQLMEGLAVAIQQRKLRFPDGPIRAELEAFEYEYTRTGVRYSAPEGMHDDCVVALALAWRIVGTGLANVPQAFNSAKRSGPSLRGHYDRSPY